MWALGSSTYCAAIAGLAVRVRHKLGHLGRLHCAPAAMCEGGGEVRVEASARTRASAKAERGRGRGWERGLKVRMKTRLGGGC